MMPNRFKGKNAVVAGGTHGMGLAMAKHLISGGAKVIVTGRKEANVEAAQQELGMNAYALACDVTRMEDIKRLRSTVQEKLGTVDAVFVNVGVAEFESFEQVTENSYDRQFQTNTKGAYFTIQQLAPLMNEGGAFVLTTVTPATATPGMSVYMGSKAALRSFAQGFAAELLPRNIRVNAIAPGFISTPTMGVTQATDEERAALVEAGDMATPMKRHGTVDEIAAAAMYLAFDATFTTGSELPVDGGLSQVDA
ncbi:SDR family oxidoreductase [Paenibacillus sp. 1P07SE]|uniref:SDR family oxidoreductase n=1 Tax=Paenibacillus sp. 1P07SE TaxID=3132209 RepID=UPI0039A6484A